MKNVIAIVLILSFVACTNSKSKHHSSIIGRYAMTAQSEYSKAMDTIEITPLNQAANTFYYVRRTGYHRISNGVLGKYEYDVDSSTCVFNEENAQLNEQREGKVYSLSRDGQQLVKGKAIYRRIQ